MAHKKSPVSHSITAFGSIMLMLAMFAGLWAVTSQSPRTKNVLTARSFYEQNNTAHILSARANDGNDRDPNWYPVSRQVIVDSNPRELDPRGLSIYKGIELLCKMEATLESTTNLQTQWPDWANLERYGWSTNIWPHDEDIRETIQLEDAFNDLGISIDPEDWYKLIQEHREESEVDGTTYPPTDGLYKNILNLKDGALIAENNASPAHVVGMRGELETTRMVPLKQWSDVVWLGIKQLTEALEEDDDNFDAKPIEHVFRFHLSNPETRARILAIAGKSSIKDLGEWPGVTFPIEENQALASLSTPNGNGVGWMLIQHKGQMGVRKVDRVNLFNCERKDYDSDNGVEGTAPRACIYYHISAV